MQKPRREATSSTNLATNLFKEAKNSVFPVPGGPCNKDNGPLAIKR